MGGNGWVSVMVLGVLSLILSAPMAFADIADGANDLDHCMIPKGAATTLEELHFYASIAAVAYTKYRGGEPEEYTGCDGRANIKFAVGRLSEEDFEGIEGAHVRRVGDNDRKWMEPEWDVTGDVVYASCGPRYFKVGIVPIERLEPDNDGGFWRIVTGIFFSLIGSSDEVIHFVEITNADGSKAVAIKGTDFDNLAEVRTSINDVRGGACALELAVSAVEYFSKKYDERGSDIFADGYFADRFFVTGHSLGGAVAQHVARRLAGWPITYFAFSSMGMTPEETDHQLADVFSYYVEGDPAHWFGTRVGRRQIGYAMQYSPKGDPDAGTKHSLDYVRASICECMVGAGRICVATNS